MGWIAAKSLFESIEAAKSTETDGDHRGAGELEGRHGSQPVLLPQVRPPDAAANLVVQVKPKITDKWDYFDVKGTVPKNAADLAKVFGTAGRDRLPLMT